MGENDEMVTMHDVMDAQWVYDNTRDGRLPWKDSLSYLPDVFAQNLIFDESSSLWRLSWLATREL